MRRYLLDEHIPPIYRTQLLYHEPSLTVLEIGDEGVPAICRERTYIGSVTPECALILYSR